MERPEHPTFETIWDKSRYSYKTTGHLKGRFWDKTFGYRNINNLKNEKDLKFNKEKHYLGTKTENEFHTRQEDDENALELDLLVTYPEPNLPKLLNKLSGVRSFEHIK